MSHQKRRKRKSIPIKFNPELEGLRFYRSEPACNAATIMNPENSDWSPDLPDTQIIVTCFNMPEGHRGMHLSKDNYAWDTDDESIHFIFDQR